MSYRSHIVGPSRAFDHIYDPLYVASDRKDICRANNTALLKSAPIGIFPVYQSMFSELPRLTRNHYVMHRNPLPYYPDVQVSSVSVPVAKQQDTLKVLGSERSKFFCHQNLGEQGGVNIQYGPDSDEEYCGCDQQHEPRVKDVGSQTMYRESSAQTQPWMPTAVLKDTEMPTAEIIYVAEMLQHTAYPGINEVEIVERARRKRNWEFALGSCESVDEWQQQKLTLQIFEWEEWVARERQIDRYQMLRLQLVAKIMEKRERDSRQATECKMENTKKRINDERNHAMLKLKVNVERNLRKLERKRNEVRVGKSRSLTGLEEVSALQGGRRNYGKQSYKYDPNLIDVGLTKLDKKTNVVRKFPDLQNQRPELWKPKQVCRDLQKGFWSDNYLRKLYESLKQFRNKKETDRSIPQCLIVVSSPTESVVTSPVRTFTARENESVYQQAVLLQRLIRGRATQEMIHKDYDAEHDLVEDLIATHRLPVVEEFFPIDSVKMGSVRERYLHILKNEQLLDEFVETSTHAQMSSLMSTLERELTRLQNERNTQAFYLLAEQERYHRETYDVDQDREYSVSEKKFMAGEEIAIYLENALLEQAEDVEQTRERIHELVRKFDSEADRRTPAEEGMGRGPGSIAASLVDEMLMPDIFRRAARENIKFKQHGLLASAHDQIYSRDEPVDLKSIIAEETGEQEKVPDEVHIARNLLDGIVHSAIPPDVYSENEVEELPEDEEVSGFFGLDDGAETESVVEDEEAQVGQLANGLIENILSQVMDASESDTLARDMVEEDEANQ